MPSPFCTDVGSVLVCYFVLFDLLVYKEHSEKEYWMSVFSP